MTGFRSIPGTVKVNSIVVILLLALGVGTFGLLYIHRSTRETSRQAEKAYRDQWGTAIKTQV